MKTKEKVSIQSMGKEELVKLAGETRAKLAEYRINRYSKQSKNVRWSTAWKRKLAVVLTVLSVKEFNHE